MKKEITKKMMCSACALFLSASALAQNYSVKQVIVANGGQFEFSAPYTDRATVGAYNPATGIYTVFDTVQVESVQAVVTDSIYAYVAAQDSIVKYDLDTYQRVGIAYYPGLKSLAVAGNHLFVGKWYGTGSFFDVYDKTTLQPEFQIIQVNTTVDGMVAIGDTAYVGYNLKGTIDACPPWGCYSDTLGRIAVIDLNTQSFVRNIDLDTTGSGIQQLYTNGTDIFAIAVDRGYVIKYNSLTASVDTAYSLNVQGGTALHSNILYANFNGNGIGAFDVSSEMLLNPSIISNFYVASAHDSVNGRFYISQTDYSTYGTVYVYDASGNVIDSFDVAVSPEAIAIDYRSLITSVYEVAPESFKLSGFPNPATDVLNISVNMDGDALITLQDITGRVILTKSQTLVKGELLALSIEGLAKGVYVLQAESKAGRAAARIIKK
jgi:hypothetical protein